MSPLLFAASVDLAHVVMPPVKPATVGNLTHGLLAAALSVKLNAEQGRPGRARAELYRALSLLAELDDRLPHELLDPLVAPAPRGPIDRRSA